MPKLLLSRVVEDQSSQTIRHVTDTQEEFDYIENLIESTKSSILATNHHYLIKTPFRYFLPIQPRYAARFRPPYSTRNCTYYSREARTTSYEYAFHWLGQRVHILGLSQEAQRRTYIEVEYDDPGCVDIRAHRSIRRIMDRKDYSASHEFISRHPGVSSVCYPSCRDPQKGDCYVIFKIETLGTQVIRQKSLNLIYSSSKKSCLIEEALFDDKVDDSIRYIVKWDDVS